MSTSDQIHKVWDKGGGVATYVVLAVLLAIGFGYAICAVQSQDAMLRLADQQRLERQSMKRAHKLEVEYLRSELRKSKEIIVRQSDQLYSVAKGANDATKAAVDVIDKQTEVPTK